MQIKLKKDNFKNICNKEKKINNINHVYMPSTYRLFSPLKLPRIGHFQHCHCLRSWTAFAQLKPYCIAECFVVFALHFSPRVVCDYLHPAKRSCPLRLKKSFALVV